VNTINTRIKNTMETLDRVGDFGTTPGLPANALATTLFPQVKAVANQMRTNGTDQTSGYGVFRGGTTDRVRIGSQLRQLVRDIVKVARVLDPVAFPGVAQGVRGPRSSSYQALLAAARAILERVTPIKAAFDETMNDLIDALEEATQQKSSGLSEQSGGTAGLADAAKRGVQLVKELDAIMTHLLRNSPSLKAAWKTASRIQRDPQPTTPAATTGNGATGTPSPTPAA
jgi:hypothetical protein